MGLISEIGFSSGRLIMVALRRVSLEVLNQGPAATREWSKEFLRNRSLDDAVVNQVLGLAEGAGRLARHYLEQRDEANAEGKEWAATSLFVYELLTDLNSGPLRRSAELSAMNLRAWIILNVGVDGTSMTDPGIIENWFFERLEFSMDRARELSSEFSVARVKELPAMEQEQVRDQVIDLRAIKNRINVLKPLVPLDLFKRGREISEWIAFWEHLP
jgi:hypothetical protein